MVEVPLWPWTNERLVGFALMEKSFGTPQFGSRNVPIRVRQLKVPVVGMYSFAYQNVQLSTGSICIDE